MFLWTPVIVFKMRSFPLEEPGECKLNHLMAAFTFDSRSAWRMTSHSADVSGKHAEKPYSIPRDIPDVNWKTSWIWEHLKWVHDVSIGQIPGFPSFSEIYQFFQILMRKNATFTLTCSLSRTGVFNSCRVPLSSIAKCSPALHTWIQELQDGST